MKIQISQQCSMEYSDMGHGPVLVLLHAFPLSRDAWKRQIIVLQNHFRVIAPSMRGFGGTTPFRSTPSIEQMADDVAALLDALAIKEPVALAGLSMGGYVSMQFARKYPQRLRGLVLCDTRAEADSDEARVKRGELIEFAQTHTTREVAERMLTSLLGETTRREHPGVAEEVLRIATPQPRETVIAALQALRDRADARPFLASIQVPSLVIVGEEDTLTPPAVAQSMASQLPQAEYVVVPRAGHLSNLEQPEQFTTALEAFLKKIVEISAK
jgi:3-oxoadipate enol-lactonase